MFLRSSSGPRPRRPYGKMAAETAAVALVLAVAVYAVVQFKDAGLVAAVLTFLGVLLTAGAKQLLEHRSDQRLRLDAAMRAGALLTPTKDAPVSSAAAASGLLALTELGRSDLAVALLVDLWPGDATDEVSVSKETAILVINAALKSGATQPSAPLVAAELLCRHADTLDPCQSLHWPSVLDGGWIPEVGPKTKLLLVEALVSMSVAADPSPNALRSFAVRIYGVWNGDSSPHVKGCVGGLISSVLPALKESPYTNFMQGSRNVTIEQLKEAAAHAKENDDEFLAHMMRCRKSQLADWSQKCIKVEAPTTHPGALVDAWCDFVVPGSASQRPKV